MNEEKKGNKGVNVQFVNKKIDDFVQKQEEQNNRILGLLEAIVNKDKSIVEDVKREENRVKVEAKPSTLPALYEEVFSKYFDREDGFDAIFDEKGLTFTIIIPNNLSNRTEAEKSFYKEDLRSKRIELNNIIGGIENWCKLVCQNLKYNKNIKLK